MLQAVEWCYARHGTGGQPDWVADRLPFVQTRPIRVSLLATILPSTSREPCPR